MKWKRITSETPELWESVLLYWPKMDEIRIGWRSSLYGVHNFTNDDGYTHECDDYPSHWCRLEKPK